MNPPSLLGRHVMLRELQWYPEGQSDCDMHVMPPSRPPDPPEPLPLLVPEPPLLPLLLPLLPPLLLPELLPLLVLDPLLVLELPEPLPLPLEPPSPSSVVTDPLHAAAAKALTRDAAKNSLIAFMDFPLD